MLRWKREVFEREGGRGRVSVWEEGWGGRDSCFLG